MGGVTSQPLAVPGSSQKPVAPRLPRVDSATDLADTLECGFSLSNAGDSAGAVQECHEPYSIDPEDPIFQESSGALQHPGGNFSFADEGGRRLTGPVL